VQINPWGEKILNSSNEGDCPSPRGDNHKRVKKFKNLLLQNQEANFNQTWHKSSLGTGNPNYSNKGPGPLHRGDNYKNGVGSFKNLLQNH
jgi:hypothetical protein